MLSSLKDPLQPPATHHGGDVHLSLERLVAQISFKIRRVSQVRLFADGDYGSHYGAMVARIMPPCKG
jgi:hypothetical protein